jgi:hypothetical protein
MTIMTMRTAATTVMRIGTITSVQAADAPASGRRDAPNSATL